jgi:hypothetical protein
MCCAQLGPIHVYIIRTSPTTITNFTVRINSVLGRIKWRDFAGGGMLRRYGTVSLL